MVFVCILAVYVYKCIYVYIIQYVSNYVEAMRLIFTLGLVSLSKTLPNISQFPTIQKQTDLGTNELHFLQKEFFFGSTHW